MPSRGSPPSMREGARPSAVPLVLEHHPPNPHLSRSSHTPIVAHASLPVMLAVSSPAAAARGKVGTNASHLVRHPPVPRVRRTPMSLLPPLPLPLATPLSLPRRSSPSWPSWSTPTRRSPPWRAWTSTQPVRRPSTSRSSGWGSRRASGSGATGELSTGCSKGAAGWHMERGGGLQGLGAG